MVDQPPRHKLPAERVVITQLGYDDLPTVRYIHAACYRSIAGRHNGDENVVAVDDLIRTQAYTDRLADAVRAGTLIGARYESELVAVAIWSPRSSGARLDSLLVRPMMTGLGVGTLLLEAVEAAARSAGYKELALSGAIDTADFFEERGFTVLSHGVLTVAGALQIPVAFMRKSLATATILEPQPSGATPAD
ncbi:MAG: GNAT family N-acetyltransferase [Hyphomicrobiaceae bacterium]